MKKEYLTGEYVWYHECGSFNGDERALTKEQLAICKRSMIMPPPTQDLFVEFTKPIHSKVRNHLKRFYQNY